MRSSLFPATRWSLIGRSTAEGHGWAALLDHYGEAVGRYLAIKFPDAERQGWLDDLVQEVLLSLLRHPELLERVRPSTEGRFRYFLMTVAYNAARNARRRLLKERRLQITDADLTEALAAGDAAATAPSREVDRSWAASLLAKAWRDFEAWTAEGHVEVEGATVTERHLRQGEALRGLAGELGIGLASVHRRLARGRAVLQRALRDHLAQAGELESDAGESDVFAHLVALLGDEGGTPSSGPT